MVLSELGVERPVAPLPAALDRVAAATSNKVAALAYFGEAQRRGHGWTLAAEPAEFGQWVEALGARAAMACAWGRRLEAEPEWPGMSPPDDVLGARSNGEGWAVTAAGQLVTVVMRVGVAPECEVPVAVRVDDRTLAAVVEWGGRRWFVCGGRAVPSLAKVGALIAHPRHGVPSDFAVIIDGAERALKRGRPASPADLYLAPTPSLVQPS